MEDGTKFRLCKLSSIYEAYRINYNNIRVIEPCQVYKSDLDESVTGFMGNPITVLADLTVHQELGAVLLVGQLPCSSKDGRRWLIYQSAHLTGI